MTPQPFTCQDLLATPATPGRPDRTPPSSLPAPQPRPEFALSGKLRSAPTTAFSAELWAARSGTTDTQWRQSRVRPHTADQETSAAADQQPDSHSVDLK